MGAVVRGLARVIRAIALPASAVLLVLAGCSTPAEPPPAEHVDRPDVLVLFVDDLRRDAVGAFGGDWAHTPNIDALAARGARLTEVVCMGSRHGAVCAPSRAMLMTGRPLTGVDDALTDVQTLPEVLRGRGYRTFMTGKWHNGEAALARAFPDARDVFLGGMCDHFAVPLRDVQDGRIGDARTGHRHSSELFADTAVEFIERQRTTTEPFFAYVAFTAPHDPRDPPPRWLKRLGDLPPPPLPPNFRGQHGLDLGKPTMMVRDEKLLGWPRDPELLQRQLVEYRALVAHLDEQIGRVLTALRRSGREDRTLVVFASDHGLALGSHGLLGKQSLYEHSMGSPVVLAGPGVPAGVERDGFAYLFDLFATVCAAAGVAPSEDVPARDLGPLARGAEPGRDVLFTLYADTQRAVREGRFKLLRLPAIDRTLMFDLDSDPHELRDLVADDAWTETRERLERRLRAEQQRWGDSLPWTAAEVGPATVDLTGRPREPDRWQPAWIVDAYFR